jgi:hypothetical protein
MPNLLDDLFVWASEQPPINTKTVKLAMTGNDVSRGNLVSYAEGTLTYHPPGLVGMFHISARFLSDTNGIKQYFSDRRYGNLDPALSHPFNPDATDPLDVLISTATVIDPQYSIRVHSSKWGFEFTVNPSFDAATQIVYAANGPTLLTLSLCDRRSFRVPG